MQKHFAPSSIRTLVIACVCLALSTGASAAPLVLGPGLDLLATPNDGTSSFTVMLPAGAITFMGTPNDPAGPAAIPMKGMAIPMPPMTPQLMFLGPGCHGNNTMAHIHCTAQPVGFADTKVRRLNGIQLDNDGDMAAISVRIEALSLMSSVPVSLSFGGGAFMHSFTLLAYLDPSVTQGIGVLKAMRMAQDKLDFTSLQPLPVAILLELVDMQTMNSIAQLPAAIEMTIIPDQSSGRGWTAMVVPEPRLSLAVAGVLCAFLLRRKP